MSLSGKNVVVTGGASGIGRGIALRLARDEAALAILDRNRGGAESVAEKIHALGRPAVAVEVDVSSATSVAAAVDRVHRELGPIHILVNSAGICTFVPFEQLTEETFDQMIAVHLKGVFLCCRAALPDMRAAQWGRVVNLSSVAGLNGGGSGLLHYASAKAGIIGFTKALAHEVGPDGITVNAIAPGLIDTPMISGSGMTEEFIDQIARRVPVRRVGQPDDIAAACAYLVGEDAGFITGQVVSPNGGGYI